MTKPELIERIHNAHEELEKALNEYLATVGDCIEELFDEHGFDYEQDYENTDDIGSRASELECMLYDRNRRITRKEN